MTKVALGVSGGIDSTISYFLGQSLGLKMTCLFFDIGQPYAQKERDALQRLAIPFQEVKIPICEFQGSPDIDKYIIPGRNTVFASVLASILPDEVWIVGLKDENHEQNHDKNQAFFDSMTQVISLTFNREIIVKSPFFDKTKTEVIEIAKDNNWVDHLTKTVSCYHPVFQQCGICNSCIKRYVALSQNGIDESYRYHQHPMKTSVAHNLKDQYLQAIKDDNFDRYKTDRVHDFLSVYERVNQVVCR